MALLRTGFAEIKNRFNAADYLRRIDPQVILDHYGARNQHEQRNGRDGTVEIVHSCLIDQVEPHHANGDENPSASMNLDKATYACYGWWRGGIFDFVMKMEGKDELHEIVGVLAQFLGDGVSSADRGAFVTELEAIFRAAPTAATAGGSSGYSDRAIQAWTGVQHPYATEVRGLGERAYERLRLGYDEKTRRLVFPHYVGGRLLGWQQRAIPDRPGAWSGSVDQDPKYKNNLGFPKASTLYNLDAAVDTGEPVVVVESPMSVAWATTLGMDNVVATFGAMVPDPQIDLMAELGRAVLWFDDDIAGLKAERRILETLPRRIPVSVVVPDPGKDLADYETLDQIRAKIDAAVPAVLRRMAHQRGIR